MRGSFGNRRPTLRQGADIGERTDLIYRLIKLMVHGQLGRLAHNQMRFNGRIRSSSSARTPYCTPDAPLMPMINRSTGSLASLTAAEVPRAVN